MRLSKADKLQEQRIDTCSIAETVLPRGTTTYTAKCQIKTLVYYKDCKQKGTTPDIPKLPGKTRQGVTTV